MKVKFCINSGANIHSQNDTGWLDTVKDLDLEENEWQDMSDDEKYEMVEQYWLGMGQPCISYEEQDV